MVSVSHVLSNSMGNDVFDERNTRFTFMVDKIKSK
jgi:hypothetical protein